MLSPRENLKQTIGGGRPDRFVKQFEFMDTASMYSDPWNATNPFPFFPGDEDKTDYWGITWTWPVDIIGAFPVQDATHKVLDDIVSWEKVVSAPPLDYPDEAWEAARQVYDAVDRAKYYAGPMMFPGIFETLHSLMSMDTALVNFYVEPLAMHELIDYIVDWECAYVKEMAANLHPDAVFHHDDWGSAASTFISPDMFDEFLLEPYKRLYGCYRENGIELIVHHSDSFAQTLVPEMIEMGIDIWQGGTPANDLSKVIKDYGGKISIMTGIQTARIDHSGWTEEEVFAEVDQACDAYHGLYFIPCQTGGGPASINEGLYEAINAAIDMASERYFI